jgi:hypothetical protein
MYRHTQRGTVILVFLSFSILLILIPLLTARFSPGEERLGRGIALAVLGILLLSMALFSSLTITAAHGRLSWQFGPGLLRKSVPLSEIEYVERARSSVLAGWGIRWTPAGWLYNVSGTEVVRVRRRNGREFFLGTDDAEGLVQAIRSAQADQARART